MQHGTRIELPPLSLYVHMPWCVRKCPYCDFNSHAAAGQIPQARYVAALLEDLEVELPSLQGRALSSVFFGGGTPSLFAPEEIGRFLERTRMLVPFAADIEVTLEANPGTIEHGRFAGYRDVGVTRVSLGAQTFDARHLKLLGRIHGSDDVKRAADELHRAGIDNFNLDLMYGLPQQRPQQAIADIDAAFALCPAHISHYQLTLEPGTVFYHRPPPLPDADTIWHMQVECQQRLAARGYGQYEVSAYAQPGRRSRHNLNYWEFGDYLGIGAGAHGKATLVEPLGGQIVRTERVRQPREYLGRAAAERTTRRYAVDARDLPLEYMLNALRLTGGFVDKSFEARTGLGFATLASALAIAQRKGLLAREPGGRWCPTELGRRFLNDLQEIFVPEARQAADVPGSLPASLP